MQDKKCKVDIDNRTYNFALEVVRIVRSLPKETAGFELGKQFLRSATSIAANIEEAQSAFSKQDFIYKMNISLKEARETKLWINLIRDAALMKGEAERFAYLSGECQQIISILIRIIKNSKL
ncbi:MAG: four helix bundle protein [Candidatus Omnitrophica bacterium CG11_big_fil_rev_8_21_14_0_20_42_13]|uniref:Four helix bundle protein n=1 Tax=Candidatus Ghiorseimicrobium undicola TaxID=1974746 RepID=A0A2H0LVM0_9BACT|nr:MAG: four helix bundle protein [Candidatus Omnitrophica bacterium CG11_big_fil_rev_8_21_14_0_20_42_13]